MELIVIANQKGGVGKTSIAVNLADRLNIDVLIDGDPQQNIGMLMQLRDELPSFRVLPIAQVNFRQLQGQRVLVDLGGFDSDVQREVLAMADVVITPLAGDAPEQLALVVFNQTLIEVSRAYRKEVKAHIVINRTHALRKDFSHIHSMIDRMEHIDTTGVVIPSAQIIPDSLLNGAGVPSRSKVHPRFEELTQFIQHKLEAA